MTAFWRGISVARCGEALLLWSEPVRKGRRARRAAAWAGEPGLSMRIYYVNRLLSQHHSAPGLWGRQVLRALRQAGAEVSCYPSSGEHATFLEVTVHGDPSDPRVDDIIGDITPQWGLHLIDVNLAMGDLITIVRQQAAGWQGGG